jgi:acyl carrier protein
MFSSNPTASVTPTSTMSVENRVAAVFEKIFKVEPAEFAPSLVPEEVLLWDSLGHMNLAMELEDRFGIQLDVDEITEMTSAGRIIEILKAKGASDS